MCVILIEICLTIILFYILAPFDSFVYAGRLVPFFFFFFSSRRRHTRYWRDWSSDVCSSDLLHVVPRQLRTQVAQRRRVRGDAALRPAATRRAAAPRAGERGAESLDHGDPPLRSEERRVGKSVDLGGRRIIKKKKTTSMTCEL